RAHDRLQQAQVEREQFLVDVLGYFVHFVPIYKSCPVVRIVEESRHDSMRSPPMSLVLIALGLCFLALPSPADEHKEQTVEQIADQCRKSVVVVTTGGRDSKRQGLGAGFIVSEDGLIATNLHVIGDGRAISVEMADGKKHDVVAVHATDRA